MPERFDSPNRVERRRIRRPRVAAPWVAALLACALFLAGAPLRAERPPAPPAPPGTTVQAVEDSLRQELRKRQERLQQLRKDLSGKSDTEVADAVAGLEQIIREIETELNQIEVEVRDNTIFFSNPSGDLRISIPEDLGERVSESINAITATILAEIPDSVDFQREIRRFKEASGSWNWGDFDQTDRKPKRKRVIGDDVIALDDDVIIAEDELVQGDVVVLKGDATILGEVTGNVIVLGGELVLGEDAVVHEKAAVVFGRMRRDEQAQVLGGVRVLSPGGNDGDVSALVTGQVGAAAKLAVVSVLILLVLLVMAVFPARRAEVLNRTLRTKTGRSFAAGLVWLTLGHLIFLVVLAVLVATVIGIPLALLLGLGYVLLGLLAIGAVARILGERFTGNGRAFTAMFVGVLLISLPGLLGAALGGGLAGSSGLGRLLEFLGLMIHATVYSLGSGALLLSRFGGRD